jgi:Protein of unknown function (DUF3102)
MSTVTAPSSELDGLALRARELSQLLESRLRSTVDTAAELGEVLIEAKAQVIHGEWGPWLADTGIAERSARRWMQVARAVKSASAADLEGATIAGLLAAPELEPEMDHDELATEADAALKLAQERLAQLEWFSAQLHTPVTREQAELFTKLLDDLFKITGICVSYAFDLGYHTELGLSWPECVERMLPDTMPHRYYVLLRDQLVALGGAR